MTPLTQEWIDKAEGDWGTASREIRVRNNPNYDAVCFHTQQCAEKYLKGFLQNAGVAFPKTHDLLNLLNLILPIEPGFARLLNELTVLMTFAVDSRYPNFSATKIEAKEAVKHCRLVRTIVRQSFNLPLK